ncbi:MAG TPA: HAMP domain-containing sensor histidine kinase [Candidatus Binataceae bacterium]|nr:HAMP domain-containing sensor histidine kinase [Candidatus Binataceae bacterium]
MTASQGQIFAIGQETFATAHSSRGWSDDVQLQSFANIAHELRTPVQVLLGYLDMLVADQRQSVAREIIERMNVNVHELAQTVENVIDLSLAYNDSAGLLNENIQLGEFFEELEEVLRLGRHKANVAVHLDVAGAPRTIATRRRALRSIVLNLASNAVKFTERGEVAITARSSGSDPTHLLIEVRDTGPGISEEDLASAFEPMVQLSQSSIRRHRGIGLGLTVVQRNVEALSGNLSVESAPGVGSCFKVTIPCVVSKQ